MGSCISSIPNHPSSPKLQIMSLQNNSSIPSTPIKDKSAIVDPSLGSMSRVSPFKTLSSYRSHGSREETFYDTQGWLESDNEEDFYSVNGDFTPSRGSTPVHSAVGTPRFNRTFSPQVNRALYDGRPSFHSGSVRSRASASARRSFSSIAQVTGTFSGVTGTNTGTTSIPKKKKLLDLFRESIRERGGFGFSFLGYESDSSQSLNASPNTPALPPKPSRKSSRLLAQNPPENYVLEKDLSLKFTYRCFPRLVKIRSFNESKKAINPATPTDDIKSMQSGRSSES